MSYSVICPSCNKTNRGSAFRCEYCKTDLIGVPRQEDAPSKNKFAPPKETALDHQAVSSEEVKIEGVGHAIWRLLRASLIIYFLAVLFAALVCYLFNWRTFDDFGNALFYTGALLAFIAGFILNGSIKFSRGQTNPLNPMNKAMLSTFSERTNQYRRDYMEGVSAVTTAGVSAALCVLSSFLIGIIAN